MKYTCINVQGNLISEEILQKIESGEAQGQLVTDFGFEQNSNLRSEIEYAWSRIKLDWKNFNDKSQNLPTTDMYGTSLSRKWMEQFLSSLGFNLSRKRSSLQGDNNQSYNISHTAENLDHLPIHIVGFSEPEHPDKNTLDIKTSGGRSKFSPHGTMQEFLNVTENVYGIAANGFFLRLIRDSGRLIKLTYVEIDIKRMMDEDKYSEFTLVYRLFHSSRFPVNRIEADNCFLEKYYQESIETGNRIRDGLSLAVKESLVALGKGFLQNECNSKLREKIKVGNLSPKNYYRQLLRIIYRLLFLMVTEERDLIYDPEDKKLETQKLKKIYLQFYSIARLRKLSERNYLYESQFNDLWIGLVNTFQLFEASGNGTKIGILPLDGDLFNFDAISDLQDSMIDNRLLLECIKNLNEFKDEKKILVAINYRSLDVEELGSVYEGLLELHPVIENIETINPVNINFTFHEGTERKTTGSYYTRPELVNELIKSALIPVIEEKLKENNGNKAAQVKALLNLKVCDTAAGSGHMLLAAARTIAWYLARIQSEEENPAPSEYRKCLRDVIQHCIYAVDQNPDAVELCKLALWLEAHNSGKPLSFLDHKIKNGNSLIGVMDLKVLGDPIPDGAFDPVTGDDKEVCKVLKKQNAHFRKTNQTDLFSEHGQQIKEGSVGFNASSYRQMEMIDQENVDEVQEVKKRFQKIRENVMPEIHACNIWTAAFVKTYTNIEDPTNPNSEKLAEYFSTKSEYDILIDSTGKLAQKHKFFHWPLEFPDVFEQGGFDVLLGNPPWERIKLQQQEFFASRNTLIANAPNASARNKMIKDLLSNNPNLHKEYQQAVHNSDCTSKFLRESSRCKLTAVGDINTYSIFAELNYQLVNSFGRIGIIVPTGIATDDNNKDFFGCIVDSNRLVSLFDFENREAIFPSVHRGHKFCLLTISGDKIENSIMQFGFFLTRVENLQDNLRVFTLDKDDFLRLNPNTKTCPIFRTKIDAVLTAKVYQDIPILIHNENHQNFWKIKFMRMFDMSNDSNLFYTKEQLENEGAVSIGSYFQLEEEVYLSLYEGKMFTSFNHRYANIVVNNNNLIRKGQSIENSNEDMENSFFTVISQYWVKESEVLKKLKCKNKPYLSFKAVTSSTNERTLLATYLPYSAIHDNAPIILTGIQSYILNACLLANLNSIVLDFIARQKVGNIKIMLYVIEQFPILPPTFYKKEGFQNIIKCVIELIYTSWDIKAFADDIWKEADADLKAAITRQWEENKAATSGNELEPPDWCEIDEEGCPLPPFKWDENRRAILKAELDAIYAKLYGLTEEELRYILDPQDVYGPDFPGETFRVLKEKEIRLYGEYRTRRLVLEAWERLKYI